MIWIDYAIFAIYFLLVLAIGFYFYKKNESKEDYYVGSRQISATHIGFSLVATDVGGGFSIGLGGLGFMIGLSGSWLLFTGLAGAWLVAIVMIPKIKKLDDRYGFLTYPDFLKHRYNKSVALVAGIISAIGYLGFTSAQILAGAKLAAGSMLSEMTWVDPLDFSLILIAVVIVLYTVLGGLKAVIYTDTVQWIILLIGLLFFGLPFAYRTIGGWQALQTLPPSHFSLANISVVQIINWFITIIPVWFVAMTLYQRIFACKSVREAKKAFFIAGLLEYPLMAFLGVSLGLMARVAFPAADAEMAMPMLLGKALPPVVTGIVLAAYFSAVMSTADSCLIAASGNLVNDIIGSFGQLANTRQHIRLSQLATLILGILAVVIAASFQTVLEIILHAYAFMVAGLFIPTIGAYFWKPSHPASALITMIGGGSLTLILILGKWSLPYGLDASLFGILFSVILFFPLSLLFRKWEVKI